MRPLALFRAAISAHLIPASVNTRKHRRRAQEAFKRASGLWGEPDSRIAAQSIAAAVRGDRDGMHELAQKLAALPEFQALDGPLEDFPTFD